MLNNKLLTVGYMSDISPFNQLRKYVMYTYGPPTMVDNYNKESEKEPCCGGIMLHSIHGSGGSSRKGRLQSRTDSISLYKKPSLPANKVQLSLYTLFSLLWFSVHHYWCHPHLGRCDVIGIVKYPKVQIL